jgi:hypothetical protein
MCLIRLRWRWTSALTHRSVASRSGKDYGRMRGEGKLIIRTGIGMEVIRLPAEFSTAVGAGCCTDQDVTCSYGILSVR